MAELVQLHIERTVPELEQMERIGLFNRDEIKKIIRRRRALEYTLRRRTKNKEDILKYIQYEINLLSLVNERRETRRCDYKKQEIDHCIASRINKLFKSVTRRFQDDVKLWISQIEFCKRMKWYHSISGLFARMLQVHSDNPTLWVMAAKWEMEENNAPENARQLLQRALRYHPKSKHLQLEYFRMELMYSDMVRKRREILGIQNVKSKDQEMENDAILDGSIASVVYKTAMTTIEDVQFALSFLPICQQFDFTQKHIEDIFEDIQFRYPNAEETLDAIARRKLLYIEEEIKSGKEKGLSKKEVIANVEENIRSMYEDAVKNVPTEKMWQFYIDYSISRIKATKKEKRLIKRRSETLALFQRAWDSDCLTCDQCMDWICLLKCFEEEPFCLDICIQAVQKWPQKVSLWHMCLSHHIAYKVDFKEIAVLFDKALRSLKDQDSFPIKQLGLQWLSLTNPSKVADFFEKGIHSTVATKHGYKDCSEAITTLKVMYLDVIALQQGLQAARALYTKLIQMPPVAVGLYKRMITIEKAQVKPSLEKIRNCYEEAVRNFGSTDIDLWLGFMKLEVENGNPNVYSMLHWRAMKALNPECIDEFVTKVALFSAGHGIDPEEYSQPS